MAAPPTLTGPKYKALLVEGQKFKSVLASGVPIPGPIGPEGPPGDTGPPGPPGSTGDQGSQGPEGEQGPPGPIGPQGMQGPPGVVGPQGSAGPQGPMGPKGDKGDTGAQGIPGTIGAQGPTGAQGPKGDKGDTGVTGSVGPTGPAGPQGAIGPTGPTGQQGLQGVQGPIGETGPQGSKGDTGEPGPQGVQGDVGPQGPVGLAGPQGDVGPQGPVGLTGPQGDVGPQGPVGLTGPQGDIGPVGPEGPPSPSSSWFAFRADTKSTAANDPGPGNLRWNTAGQQDATALYVDWITADGFDVTALWQMMNPPERFILQDSNLAPNYQVWQLTGPVVIMPDWLNVPVQLVEFGQAGLMESKEPIAIILLAEGVPGPPGPAGAVSVQDEGIDLPARTYLNFVGESVVATDDPDNDRVVVTITGGSQTPWTSDINAAGHKLINVGSQIIGSLAAPTAVCNLEVQGPSISQMRIRGTDTGNNTSVLRFYGGKNAADTWAIGTDVFASGGTDLHFYNFATSSVMFSVTGTGVGFGTPTPQTTLDSIGTIRSTGSSSPLSGAGIMMGYSAGSNYGYIVAYDYTASAPKMISFNPGGGNCGFAKTNPAYQVDISGDCNVTGVFRVGGTPLVAGVSTVFGRAGAVVAVTGDYTAAKVTNAVDTTQTYSNPAWITALAWSKITGAPTIFADPTTTKGDIMVRGTSAPATRLAVGATLNMALLVDSSQTFGIKWATMTASMITNAADTTQTYNNPTWINQLAWSKITGAPAFITSPLTTKGDLFVYGTSATRLPVGSNGQVLLADSTQTLGVKWGAAGGSQTPWTSNIDGGNFTLENVGGIDIGASGFPQANTLTVNGPSGSTYGILVYQASTTTSSGIYFQNASASGYTAFGVYQSTGGGSSNPNNCTFINAKVDIMFQTGDSSPAQFRMTANGRLGIGYLFAAPAYVLDVNGDCNLAAGSVYRINGVPLATGSPQTPWTSNIDGGNFNLVNVAKLAIGTATATVKCLVTGVGSTSGGTCDVQIVGSGTVGAGINLTSTDTGGKNWALLSTGSALGAGGFGIYDASVGSYAVFISSSHNVGFGTSTPQAIAHLKNAGGEILRLETSAGIFSTSLLQTFYDNSGSLRASWGLVNGITTFTTTISNTGFQFVGGPIGILKAPPFSPTALDMTGNAAMSGCITIGGADLRQPNGTINLWNVNGVAGSGSTRPSPIGTTIISGEVHAWDPFDTRYGLLRLAAGNSATGNQSVIDLAATLNSGTTEFGCNIVCFVSNVETLRMNTNGCGIRMSGASPAFYLHVGYDSAGKPSTSTWTVSSDLRVKRNVKELTGGLDIIKQLVPVEAEYNGFAGTPEGARVVSFVAQEISKILPYTVTSHKAKLMKDDEEEADILDLNIHEVLMHLVLAVKQLAAGQRVPKKG